MGKLSDMRTSYTVLDINDKKHRIEATHYDILDDTIAFKDVATTVAEFVIRNVISISNHCGVEKITENTGTWANHPFAKDQPKLYRGWDVCTHCGTGCKRRDYGLNPDGSEYVTEYNYPYCPNCGARMIKKENTDNA